MYSLAFAPTAFVVYRIKFNIFNNLLSSYDASRIFDCLNLSNKLACNIMFNSGTSFFSI